MEFLIEADGFNSGAGRIGEDAWKAYTSSISKLAGIREQDALFEIGSGSGAFLYDFYKKGHTVGGIDYSPSLIDLARFAMPHMDFHVQEAIHLDPEPEYDFVVANSVFQYFPSYDYAAEVIRQMYRKSKRTLALLDLNDLDHAEEALRIRKGALSSGEYEKKYSGLDHLFYEREFVSRVLKDQDATVRIFDQQIENYGNNKFRFNVVIEKW
ncbi:Methyltransferase domain-containing protein [Saccharibacillus brassicae]